MRTYILAGGYGTRISELTDVIPKPMVQIGSFPILLHIISHYSKFGVSDFVVLSGYKFEKIQEYFSDGYGRQLVQRNSWRVQVVNTGVETTTAGRLLKVRDDLPSQFMLTYGDGLSDIDIAALVKFHENSGLIGTVTAVRPPARFGSIEFRDGIATSFREKDPQKSGWINGGFFCFSRQILDYISDESQSLESKPLEELALARELAVFPHEGFWHPMDTLRDHRQLQDIWNSNTARWFHGALG